MQEMQSINKIHINSSTEMSLNDRFTIMQRTIGSSSPSNNSNASLRRIRMRSASNSRILNQSSSITSTPNRRLLEQLDKKHKMRAALKLKRRSLRGNLSVRQNQTNRANNRIGLKRATQQSTLNRGRFRRSNSLSNVRIMQADLVGMTRSNSITNIANRLGNGGRQRKLNRSNLPNVRGRSNSRQRLELRTRSNSQASLRRANSQTNLRRTNSRQSLRSFKRSNSRQRTASQQRQPQQNQQQFVGGRQQQRANSRRRFNQGVRRLSTSNLPNRRTNNNYNVQQQQQQQQTFNNKRIGKRRLSTAGRNVNNNQRGAIRNGRILKPRNSNVNVRSGGNNVNRRAIQQRGRSRSRVSQQQINQRSRSTSRGRPNNRQGNGNNNKNFQNRSNGLNNGNRGGGGGGGGRPQGRSRSRARRNSTGPGARGGKQQPVKTKEELDRELDQYMVNTKAHNDMDGIF